MAFPAKQGSFGELLSFQIFIEGGQIVDIFFNGGGTFFLFLQIDTVLAYQLGGNCFQLVFFRMMFSSIFKILHYYCTVSSEIHTNGLV